ncbi:MAG: PAS domain S-box protein [Thermoplasmata archaeon]|nr:MAG: PAS domain S-box protein [Thermoplasmata archaeon]
MEGGKYYVAYAPIREINGSIAFLIEEEKIMQPIISLRNGVYMAIAILGVFGIILSLIFSKSITTPLEKLQKGAEEVAKGNLDYKIEKGGRDEIGMVTEAFNKMVQELKKSQAELKESERRYRELFEGSKDAVYITTKDGKIVDVNKAFEELFGYSKKELLKMNARDMYLKKEDREKFQKKIEKNGFVKDYEVKFRRKDGKVLDCLLTSNVKRDSNGKVIGYYGIIRDVTEIKEAQRKIEAYNILMRHDINNRNQIAIGYLEILRDMNLTEEQKEYVERVLKVVKASQNLLDRVRVLNKAREKHRLVRKNIEEVVRKAIREHAHDAIKKGIRISYNGKGIDVMADDMAENIFSNILENAITHSECSKIAISIEEKNDFCKVSIEDDGKGIPKEIRDSLFLFGVKGKDSPGSGLGLHLVKTIVEGYGGFIKVRDRKNGGTIFDVYLKKWK